MGTAFPITQNTRYACSRIPGVSFLVLDAPQLPARSERQLISVMTAPILPGCADFKPVRPRLGWIQANFADLPSRFG